MQKRGRRDGGSRPRSRTCGEYDESELEVLLYELKADLERLPGHAGTVRAREDAGRRHRVQRGEPRPRDAVLRAGALPQGAGEGPAHGQGVPGRAGQEPPPVARGRPRRRAERAQARRHRGADRRPRLADRLRGRRPLRRRQLDAAPRSPAIRTSRCPAATRSGCPWGSRSWAAPGASRRSSASPTPTSRPRAGGRRRATSRAWDSTRRDGPAAVTAGGSATRPRNTSPPPTAAWAARGAPRACR